MTELYRKKATLLSGLTLLGIVISPALAQDLSRGWEVVRQDGYKIGELPMQSTLGVDLETFRSRVSPDQLLRTEPTLVARTRHHGSGANGW